MSEVSIAMEYHNVRMLADSTASVILYMGEMETKKLLYLLAEGAVQKGTSVKMSVEVDYEAPSTGAGP